MKLISFAVPCYNSRDYMRRCIDSLLVGGEDVEIIIVDDGSTDDTLEIAREYQREYPSVVRVIHKSNGGHGSAVNAGLAAAKGLYFKVVDSDDRLEEPAYLKIMGIIRSHLESSVKVDMYISNFFYDNRDENKKTPMRYRAFLPRDRVFTWKDMRYPVKGSYILMHSVIYRTALLKKTGLRLPENTFYVDNLFVFKPMPYVRRMYYLDENFYDYIIGRDDQSVREDVMISRIDQQIRVNKEMYRYYSENYSLIRSHRRMGQYMLNYLEIITAVSSIMLIRSGTRDHIAKKNELWDYMKERDIRIYRRLRYTILGIGLNLPGEWGRKIASGVYGIFRNIWKFN